MPESLTPREMLNICFGECNVNRWADIDNDCVEETMQKAIDWAYGNAEAYVNAMLVNVYEPGCEHRLLEDIKCKLCLLYTSPSPRDRTRSRMPSSA